MSCPFEKNRPCGSYAKGKNRYTKVELHKIAQECGIKNVEKKTMDKLCKELSELKSKNPSILGGILNLFGATSQKKPVQKAPPKKIIKKAQQLSFKQKQLGIHDRPCGPKKSGKNPTAYSRDELVSLAYSSGYKVSEYPYKKQTIPQLCAALKLFIKKTPAQKSAQSTQIMKKLQDNKKNFANKMKQLQIQKTKKLQIQKKKLQTQKIKQLQIQKTKQLQVQKNKQKKKYSAAQLQKITPKAKKCSVKSKNAFKPNYKCDPVTGTWKKIPKSGDYHYKYELQKMSQDKLKEIAQNLKTKSQGNKKQLIQNILKAQYPLAKLPYNQKNKYIQKFKKILLSKAKSGPKMYTVHTKAPNSIYKPTLKIMKINAPANIERALMSKTPFKTMTLKNTIGGHKNLLTHKTSVGSDITGITDNLEWLDKQFEYQTNLHFLDQLTVLAYTYAGDVMIHSYLDKKFDVTKLWNYEYTYSKLHPLYPPLLKMMTEYPKEFMSFCIKNKPSLMSNELLKVELITQCGYENKTQKHIKAGNKIFEYYVRTIRFFFDRNDLFTQKFYETLVSDLKKDITSIIFRSPRLPHNIYVYKGVKDMEFLTFNEREMYHNKRFISTTIDMNVAKKFSGTGCCYQKIYLLRNTACLYVCISFFEEFEVLLPPDRLLYPTKKLYTPSNSTVKTTNLIVTN